MLKTIHFGVLHCMCMLFFVTIANLLMMLLTWTWATRRCFNNIVVIFTHKITVFCNFNCRNFNTATITITSTTSLTTNNNLIYIDSIFCLISLFESELVHYRLHKWKYFRLIYFFFFISNEDKCDLTNFFLDNINWIEIIVKTLWSTTLYGQTSSTPTNGCNKYKTINLTK